MRDNVEKFFLKWNSKVLFFKDSFLEPNFPIIMIENECGTTLITSARGTIFRDRPDILNFRAKKFEWKTPHFLILYITN